MKNIKTFLWFVGLMTVCTAASAEPITAGIAWLAANATTVLAVAGTVMTVASAADARSQAKDDANAARARGEQAAQGSENEAAQLQQQAGQQRASAQREAQEQRRRAAIASSNAQARAGGGSTDSSILGLTGDIAGEGEYNALTAMYEGEERAIGSETQASAAIAQAGQYRAGGEAGYQRGQSAARAATTRGFTSALTGASSLYSKYGGGGAGAYDPVDSYRYSTRGSGD